MILRCTYPRNAIVVDPALVLALEPTSTPLGALDHFSPTAAVYCFPRLPEVV